MSAESTFIKSTKSTNPQNLPKIFTQILLFFAFILSFANADEIKSRLVYITSEIVKPSELRYIGEIVAVKYSVLVLENAEVRSIGFLEGNGVAIQNADSAFETMDDGSLEKIVYFKILDKNFAFPQLEVIVQNAESSDVSISKEMRGTAIDLRPNHPNFSGVVAENLKVTPNVREYDAKNNIILLDFSAQMANLEDFKIPHLKKQGFESFEGIITRSNGLFYVVLSNQIAALDFEYFDLKSQSYKQEHIKNIATSTSVSINQEIAPINKVLIFKNIVILGLSFVLFVAFLIRKIPFKIRVSLLVAGILLLLFVVISVNINEKSLMKNDSYLRILPTTNSTIIAKIPANAEVQIISRHNDYIKILTKDNKTGWVEKASVK
ncbi:SH3 domain-containing protein [Helicobacter sp. 23-1044]